MYSATMLSSPSYEYEESLVTYKYTKYNKILLLIQKHLMISLAKLQIDILNLNINFRHCKKKKKIS